MVFTIALLLLAGFSLGVALSPAEYPLPCNSEIYCQGQLLHTVQMSGLYKDSKYFVDMSLVHEPEEVLEDFGVMMNKTQQNPSKQHIGEFVERNFRKPGSELVAWDPRDWHPKPAILLKIKDDSLRKWMEKIHSAWKQLGRRVSGDVHLHNHKHSLIYVPNPTIVPGGRFREFYYWDSYWVIKGLLLSEMKTTVKGMLINFLTMVKRFSFVPNGGRLYYARRSQPPYLIPMVHLYLEATDDVDFLRLNIDFLEQEFNFWKANRTVEVEKNGVVHEMFRYNVEVGGPRPESYKEDYRLVTETQTSEEDRQNLYAELKTAAESGWDFSSRWFRPESGAEGTLKDLRIRSIVPVDLNSMMFLNAKLLAAFHERLNDSEKAEMYRKEATRLMNNIRRVLWDGGAGSWFDYDIRTKELNKNFYPSNIYPVWVGASNAKEDSLFLAYLKKSNATSALSGVPTSMLPSGEQWDHPNAWPPLQHVMVESLRKMKKEEAHVLARRLAQSWIDTNYLSYYQSHPHAMFEKYDVDRRGLPGGGGEYDVQLGFGWTNGVAMDFCRQYGDTLVAPSLSAAASALGRATTVADAARVCWHALLVLLALRWIF